jgi:hypothetical protein
MPQEEAHLAIGETEELRWDGFLPRTLTPGIQLLEPVLYWAVPPATEPCWRREIHLPVSPAVLSIDADAARSDAEQVGGSSLHRVRIGRISGGVLDSVSWERTTIAQ